MNGWGAYCTFYYQGQTARTSTAYIYIKNADQKPAPAQQPSYGSMSGRAYQETERLLTVFLQNGDAIHLPTGGGSCTCNIYGGSVSDIGYAGGGASCVVYYINSPTVDNIYQFDVFIEKQAAVFEPDNGGGYAGSQYYANEPSLVFIPDRGGYSGAQYYANEPNYYGGFETHISYNTDGSTYEAIWCHNCGKEVSLAMDICPNCGRVF